MKVDPKNPRKVKVTFGDLHPGDAFYFDYKNSALCMRVGGQVPGCYCVLSDGSVWTADNSKLVIPVPNAKVILE